ncbi:hypothetical protein ES705_36431 [subsurface metagenome]
MKKEAEKFQSQKKKLKDLNIIEFAENPVVLGLSFAKRPVQKIILKALYGMNLNEKELKIFNTLTKNKGVYKPGTEKTEAVMCLGARAGKSFIASICALYEAIVGWQNKPWKESLSVREYCYVCIIATKELQARQIIQTNCLRMLERSPMLKGMIKRSTDLEITLRNYVKIISGPCNSTALRGLPIAVLIMDEIAFYRLEGPRSDDLIFNSLRPRMAQFIEGKLFLISTAGSRQGLFYNFFNEGFRVEDRLTIQANTRFVNPEIPQKFLDKEKARDIDNYNREFNAEFSEKLESFFPYELIEKPFTLAGDLGYKSKNIYYMGFDQSGLSGQDRFALSIGHAEKEKVLIDVVRSWITKDLETILNDIKKLKSQYHISNCLVDKYAIGYIRNAFKKIGLDTETRPALPEIYVVMKSLILQDNLSLPDRSALKAGMRNTLAIYNKSNQLSIYHQRGVEGHADELDSVACCTCAISKKMGGSGVRVRSLEDDDEEDSRGWQTIGGSDESNLLPEKYHQI